MFLQNSILEQHLKIIARNYLKNASITSKKINFRCNVCGDTEKNRNKKSAYLWLRYNSKLKCDTWQFYCHRGSCETSMLAEIWLQKYFPANFQQYQKDLLSISEETKEEIKKSEHQYEIRKKQEVEENKIEELENVKFFEPISEGKGKEFEDAIKICENRLIDKEIWKNWFVARDEKNKLNKYRNRIIIPFFDDNDEIYYWQARKIYDWMEPKYLNRKDNRDIAVYNAFKVDKTKEVIVVEGPIDSLFLNNSIAILGTNITENAQLMIKDLNKFYLFDNDKAGYKKSLEYLLSGNYVFLWKLFLKDLDINKKIKDVNDLVLDIPELKGNLDYPILSKYFSNNVFDKFYLI